MHAVVDFFYKLILPFHALCHLICNCKAAGHKRVCRLKKLYRPEHYSGKRETYTFKKKILVNLSNSCFYTRPDPPIPDLLLDSLPP